MRACKVASSRNCGHRDRTVRVRGSRRHRAVFGGLTAALCSPFCDGGAGPKLLKSCCFRIIGGCGRKLLWKLFERECLVCACVCAGRCPSTGSPGGPAAYQGVFGVCMRLRCMVCVSVVRYVPFWVECSCVFERFLIKKFGFRTQERFFPGLWLGITAAQALNLRITDSLVLLVCPLLSLHLGCLSPLSIGSRRTLSDRFGLRCSGFQAVNGVRRCC